MAEHPGQLDLWALPADGTVQDCQRSQSLESVVYRHVADNSGGSKTGENGPLSPPG
jgi:hypothetical protein